MKLIENLKNQVDKAKDKDEARKFISEAGMELTTDELEIVTGGVHKPSYYAYKAPNDTNQMPRGMRESAVVEQYSPLP